MNNGTIIRTVLVIATCLNTALLATDVAQFGNETVNLVYRILSVIANFVIVFCATWFNNDYTEAAAIGTGITRQIKAEGVEALDEYDFDDEVFEDEDEDADEEVEEIEEVKEGDN